MSTPKRASRFIAILTCAIVLPVSSQTDNGGVRFDNPPIQDTEDEKIIVTREVIRQAREKLKEYHARLSSGIVKSAKRIDNFFGNKNELENHNGTSLRIYDIYLMSERRKPVNDVKFKFKLRLPQLKERLQLSFENERARNDSATSTPEDLLATDSRTDTNELQSALSQYNYFLTFNTRISVGLKFTSTPIPYINFRVSKENLFGNWRTRIVNNVFENKRDGFGQDLSFDIDRQLSDDFMLRLVNEQSYFYMGHRFNTSHGPSVFHTINDKNRLSYNLRANFRNKPNYQIESYFAGITYRYNIYEHYLFFEISPGVFWEKDDNFKARHLLALKLELQFSE